ncbi:PaaX family transcriptional regulator C-terminal domain-containing protein [Aeromicrobium endophyticum]|uniref:PaaX domain-containing protein, C-domain protein n=1 Tax=Aeromicrobium endophyticum TaxID=2292704 RepID=A0A371PD13_9ACTN|nr:PaaX family transcriptional regulator C-terminal domain-containing protein [Aeromicrobium endophyticum]REK73797.1 PaaX domain-containing protein, C- domain protein [Aeromicrobium endophyticum]
MPEFPPLSARSAILSLLLGTPSRSLSAAQLAAAARHLDINPATVRVALTRAVAADELVRDGTSYRLGPRLVERRARQDAHEAVVPWDGSWETAVVVTTGRPGTDRAALRTHLAGARLAELREGVWMRPANLRRATTDLSSVDVRLFRATPDDDPAGLAADLWDLSGWAAETVDVLSALDGTTGPGRRLAVAAHLVRHLATDPLLPDELQPQDWPAAEARRAYAGYLAELEEVVSD